MLLLMFRLLYVARQSKQRVLINLLLCNPNYRYDSLFDVAEMMAINDARCVNRVK